MTFHQVYHYYCCTLRYLQIQPVEPRNRYHHIEPLSYQQEKTFVQQDNNTVVRKSIRYHVRFRNELAFCAALWSTYSKIQLTRASPGRENGTSVSRNLVLIGLRVNGI